VRAPEARECRPDQLPAQTVTEMQPLQEPCVLPGPLLERVADTLPSVPEECDHCCRKLAQPSFAPEIKQLFLELPDLFPEHLACSSNTEDGRSCQRWPEVTAKRLGLDCDESDVRLNARGDG
jgi:hypothetical protein